MTINKIRQILKAHISVFAIRQIQFKLGMEVSKVCTAKEFVFIQAILICVCVKIGSSIIHTYVPVMHLYWLPLATSYTITCLDVKFIIKGSSQGMSMVMLINF